MWGKAAGWASETAVYGPSMTGWSVSYHFDHDRVAKDLGPQDRPEISSIWAVRTLFPLVRVMLRQGERRRSITTPTERIFARRFARLIPSICAAWTLFPLV
jgi:hypothetical protein